MTAPLRLAVAQLAPVQADIEANASTVCRVVGEYSGRADLVAFPELFLSGYDIGTEQVRSF